MIACRWKKRLIWIIGILLFSLLCAIAIHEKWIDFGVDTLTKPQKSRYYYIEDIEGQLHLSSPRSKFGIEESATLTISTAYFDLIEQAQRAEYISFRLIHSEYLDVVVNGASNSYDSQLPPDADPELTVPKGDVDQIFVFNEFDPNSLVYRPVNGRITRDSLPYSVTITIKVNPGAPDKFEDVLTILTGVKEDLSMGPDHPPVYTSEKSSRISIRIVKDGDTVKIYA